MTIKLSKIGFGGGCHWCTEAVFQSISEVDKVEQGWIKSEGSDDTFSEAVLLHFSEKHINLYDLIKIHINTHSATSYHSMRSKYRSAIYTFSEDQVKNCTQILDQLQEEMNKTIITKILPFSEFKLNQEDYLDYYYKNPDKPFCQTYIKPKLQMLENLFEK